MSAAPQLADHTLRAAIANGRMNRRAWLVTGMLVVFQIINFADKAVLGLVADPAMRDLGLSAGEFGLIGSSFFFLFAISAVVVGFLAGRVHTRWILLAMGVSWAVIQLPMLAGGGAAVLLVTRILLGAAEGPATPISLQHAHGWFSPAERGLPSSLVAAGSTLGPIVAAPILAWIIAHPELGWRWAFGFLGVIGLVWSLAWLLVGRDGPFSHMAKNAAARGGGAAHDAGDAPSAVSSPPAGTGTAGPAPAPSASASIAEKADALAVVPIRRILGTRMFAVAVLAGAGCFWAQGFLTTWSPKYLASVVAVSPEAIGALSTLPWIVGAVALLVLGYASRFLMRRGVTVRWALGALFGGTLLLSGLCFLLLPGLHGAAAIVAVTVGAGFAMIYPLAPTAVAFCVSSRQRAAVMATLTGFASLGGVVAPAMVGALMDAAGYVPAPKGVKESAAMIARLTAGMDTSFWMIGAYLVAVGALSVLLLNPDRTAARLQEKFAFRG
ncbi:MFS transporter [Sinomonas cyclohexanicum]|uniref:MFS transporter n=1 Tax=Sinomonas cyclohexanicum TaxID=322009 RepID=A0ABN6FEV7_SINCY|nr:MFS transporter [Corynebacterium cyclohexanicum]BCT74363.1 MFS transporter [Corynebacterium cyclohexanicum]